MVIRERSTAPVSRRSAGRPRRIRAALLAASSIAALAAAGAASAQTGPSPPKALPVRESVDANGVDLMSGQMSYSDTMLSIGTPGAGGLALTFNGDLAYNLSGAISVSGAQYTASYGAQTWNFTQSGSAFTSNGGDGATLTSLGNNSYQLTASDGTVILYNEPYAVTNPVPLVATATQPSGDVTTFNYRSYTFSGSETDVRLQSVTTSRGYMMKFGYASTSGAGSFYPNSVTAINNAVDYCAPTADSCTGLTVSWPSVSISSDATTITGPTSHVVYPPILFSSGQTSYTKPSGQAEAIYYTSGRVSSVSTAAGTWGYTYNQGSDFATTVTDPLGHTRVVHSSLQSGNVAPYVTSDTDGTNHTTTYGHDGLGRLTSVTTASGLSVTYNLDARGNATNTVYTPKAGSGQSPVTITSNFDASCASPAKCNQANYVQQTVNGATQQTSYAYNATTGQVTTVTASTGANGVAPQTRYNYASLQALAKNSSGGLAAAGPAVSVLQSTSACATTSWSGSSCGSSSDEVDTTYGFNTSSSPNLLPVSITNGNSGLSATTQLTWTNLGDLATSTDPRSAMTMMRYDAGRELVGVVGPDPDGSGPLHNRATRYVYGNGSVNLGLVTRVDQGVVNSYSDADWNGITVLTQQLATYDGADRLTKQSFVAGTGVQSVTQTSYDAANRVTCATVRMNSAAFGSLPSDACQQSTLSSFGPDRITSYGYDNADRVTSATTGYASSGYAPATQRTEVTNTWGVDGELTSQQDAKGDLTTYVYDGFDRLSKVEPPNPASGGSSLTNPGSSGSTGYEAYTYDEASNIRTDQRRDGTVITYGYDNLNNRTSSNVGGYGWSYDNFGRLLSASVSGGPTISYVYDALGRRTSEANSGLGTMSSGYDLGGNRTSLSYAGGGFLITFAYDLTGAMTQVGDAGGNPLVSYVYNDLGQRTTTNRANGVQTSFQYDYAQNPSYLQHSFSNPANTVGETYHFTPAGQIFGHITSNPSYSWTSSSQPNLSYGTDGQNRYTSVGGVGYSYDAQGNLHGDGTNTYNYDAYGRLTAVSGGASAALGYDGLGRLWTTLGSARTYFLYDGDRIAAEYDGSGNLLRRYVPGAAPLETSMWFEGGSERWMLQDRRGSVMGSADGSQTLTTQNTYDESGVPGASNAGRLQLNGLPWIPEAGLYLFGQRYYSPTLGRFLQPDPTGYADSLNLYRFAADDPGNLWDPSGLNTVCSDPTNCSTEPVTVFGDPITQILRSFESPFPLSLSSGVPGFSLGAGPIAGAVPPLVSASKPPIGCGTTLPNGKTVGQIVTSAVSDIEDAAGPYGTALGEFGAFLATVRSGGPIDFKNRFGPDRTGSLGAAGNFAYGAIASGIGLPQSVAEAGAGYYAAKNGKFSPQNPFGEDNSAAQNIPGGYASKGCRGGR